MTAVHPPITGVRRAAPSRARRHARFLPQPAANDVALIALVLAGSALRLWALGRSKLNYDESFTAMAGRLPVHRLFSFLTAHDSHPPLDYLLHAPFARAGVSEFWFRFPSAACSVAALAMLAWWLRPRGRVAIIATALFAVSAFEIAHGRDARMYAELEVLGVGVAMVADRWLRAPQRHHAPLVGALVLAGLYTHVSMFLLAAGLFTLAGLRRDGEAWRWRVAIVVPVAIWAVTWGPHFLVQARGGHSAWIPATSVATLTEAIARSVTFDPTFTLLVVAAVVLGAVVLHRRDRPLGRVWLACFAVPVAIAAVAGLAEPVVLDRTFTLMAWAPAVALAFLVDALFVRQRLLAVAVVAVGLTVLVPDAMAVATTRTGPTAPIEALTRRVQPGDVVAVRPASKAPELQWSLAVRAGVPGTPVEVAGLPRAFALRIGAAPPTGRVWFLDWHAHRHPAVAALGSGCGTSWHWGGTLIDCLTGRHVELASA